MEVCGRCDGAYADSRHMHRAGCRHNLSHGRYFNTRRYAVGLQTGCFTRWKADVPAATWYVFFFRTTFAQSANVVRKMGSSALPEAVPEILCGK